MTIKLPIADNEHAERMINGCNHYGLKTKFNKRTNPYVHIEVNTEDDVVNIFWLGANLSHPKRETALTRSSY